LTEVRDDHPAVRPFAEMAGEDGGDIFIGQPVKAVALDALLGEPARQRERRRDVRLGRVERGVEAGDLRDLRVQPRERADRLEIVGLMQRRERNQLLEIAQYLWRD